MSNAIFPTMPGLDIAVTKEAELNTLIQASATGKELRVSQRAYPIWKHKLKFNFLRDTTAYPELQQLIGFYLARNGPTDNFLFNDTDDNFETDQPIGTGTGAQTDYQLVRSFGAFTEPVFNPNLISNVRVNGGGVSYTLQPNGVIRFASAPANGAVLTSTFSFYFRSRFQDNTISAEKFLHLVWSNKGLNLVSSLQDKI